MEKMQTVFVLFCLLLSIGKFKAQETETVVSPSTLSTTSSKATTTEQPTQTTPHQNDENEKINLKIQNILETSRIGYIVGNNQFDQQSAYLRHIASLDAKSMQLKIQSYHRFLSYNYLRLELENNLLSRLAVAESYLLDVNLSERCRTYYENMKTELMVALNEDNNLKAYKLNTFSKACQDMNNKVEYEDEDVDYGENWISWLQLFPQRLG